MNNVSLIGRLTQDPELRTTSSGLSTCSFTIAVDGRPSANGEPHTDFIRCVAWRNQAENLCKYQKKGSQIGVTGRIQTGSYDAQDGTKRYTTEVVADNVEFLGTKASNETSNYNNNHNVTPADFSSEVQQTTQPTTTNVESDPFADFGASIEINDDELPF